MARVSICIPAYEQPGALKRCLDSVFVQTYQDFELCISDDTSGDSVAILVEEYMGRGKIQYKHNVPPKGSPENWNEAMRGASGDLVIVMHHDDWFYETQSLGCLVGAIENSQVDLAFARSFNVSLDGSIISINDPNDEVVESFRADIRRLFYGNIFGAPSAVLFRKRDVFFDTRLRWLVDLEFYIRYLDGRSFVYARDAIVGVGLGPSQMTLSCQGNPEVEIPESILVYRGLRHSLFSLLSDYRHFKDLFSRFDVSRKTLAPLDAGILVLSFFSFYRFLLTAKTSIRKILRHLSLFDNRGSGKHADRKM